MYTDDDSARRRAEIREFLDSWDTFPAFLRDRYLTVVASNGLARMLSPSFEVGVNLARFTFLDPMVQHRSDAWKEVAEAVAAELRDSVDQHEQDTVFSRIVGELSAKSRSFSETWAAETPARVSGEASFDNDVVGRITLAYQQLRVPENYDDVLVVWRATDAASQRAMSRLIDAAR
jgi:hypothetical protein